MPFLEHEALVRKLQEVTGDAPGVVPPEMQAWRAEGGAPVIVLVHGHTATKKSWTDPYAESLGGGLLPFDLVLTDWDHEPRQPWFYKWRISGLSLSTPLRLLSERPVPMWEYLQQLGYNLITWSQREPNGKLRFAVEELEVILRLTEELFNGCPCILLCHSRGGLVARKYIQENAPSVRKVILLSTPNHGTSAAVVFDLLGEMTGFLGRLKNLLFYRSYRNKVRNRIADRIRTKGFERNRDQLLEFLSGSFMLLRAVLEGEAVDEMRPGATLMKELKRNEQKERASGIEYVSLAGASVTYNRLYFVNSDNAYQETVSIFDVIQEVVWNRLVPDELKAGRGDGLVSVERAKLSWAPMGEKEIFAVNHATILTDAEVRERIKQECANL